MIATWTSAGAATYDLAIRIDRLDDSALKARRIATSQRGIYGSPAYVQREGRPRTRTISVAMPAWRPRVREQLGLPRPETAWSASQAAWIPMLSANRTSSRSSR